MYQCSLQGTYVGLVRVLTEKPMTTDAEKCRRILDTVNKTGNHVTVTFNYRFARSLGHFGTRLRLNGRYNPVHELVKRTLAEGKIGKSKTLVRIVGRAHLHYVPVLSVHFEWLLDTVHGAGQSAPSTK